MAFRALREEDFEAATDEQLLDAWQRNRALIDEILADSPIVPASIAGRGWALRAAASNSWLEFAEGPGGWEIRAQVAANYG